MIELETPSTKTGIAFGSYIPEGRLTNEEIESWQIKKGNTDKILTAKDIAGKIGVEHARSLAGPKETIEEMALWAAQNALRSKTDVDIVLFSTSTPTGQDGARLVANELGVKPEVAHNFHMACAGGAGELAFLAKNQERFRGARVLAVASEKLQPLLAKGQDMQEDSSFNATIFSDGAHATVFTVGEGLTFLSGKVKELEKPEGVICMPNDFKLATGNYSLVRIPRSRKWITQKGPEVFKAVVDEVPPVVRQLARDAKLDPEDTVIVSHQPSKRVVDRLVKDLKEFQSLPSDYQNGNYSSGADFKLLERLIQREGTLKKGDTAVIVGFGAGPGMIITGVAARIG